jgi:Phosphate-selective porin O and P
MMRRPLFAILTLLFAAGFARGQDTHVPDEAEQIKALLARVELLEKQVAELKAAQVAAAATVNPASAVAPLARQAAQMQEHGGQMPQEVMQQLETHYPSLQIRGFADADFSATDQKGTTSGFDLGQFDLHIASALSRKISYFSEITVNAHPADYTIEMERSFIRYDYNDYFKISFGRFHTPIGYWNTAYHHGAWLETTVDRPFIFKVGGTFTPLHFVGALAEGNIPSGGLGLGYNVGIGNGRGSLIGRPGDAGDVNNNRALVAKVFARPPKVYGLEVGGSVYRDKISLPAGSDYREWIASGYLTWSKGAPEFLAEFENVNHLNIATNAVANSDAFYVQFGYRLPWFEKTVKPYYRFEYTHMPLSEQVFAYQPQVESIAGLRYDISSFAAFKLEYRHLGSHPTQGINPAQAAVNAAFLQTAFTF